MTINRSLQLKYKYNQNIQNTSVRVDENYEYCTFTQLLTYHVSQEEKIIMIAFVGVLEMLIESRKVI